MNALSIPPAWSDCVADSGLAKRVQHVEDGHAADVRRVGTSCTNDGVAGNWQASEELSRPLRLDSVTAQKEYQEGPAVLDVTKRRQVQDFGVYSSADGRAVRSSL